MLSKRELLATLFVVARSTWTEQGLAVNNEKVIGDADSIIAACKETTHENP